MSVVYALTSEDIDDMLPTFLWLFVALPIWGPAVVLGFWLGSYLCTTQHWHLLFSIAGGLAGFAVYITWIFGSAKALLVGSDGPLRNGLGIAALAFYYASVVAFAIYRIPGHDLVWTSFAAIVAAGAGTLFGMYLSHHWETEKQEREEWAERCRAIQLEREQSEKALPA